MIILPCKRALTSLITGSLDSMRGCGTAGVAVTKFRNHNFTPIKYCSSFVCWHIKVSALAGRERDAASQVLRKSQTDLSIAVAKHDKLQGQLRLKSMTVELVRSAWESAKVDAGVKEAMDPKL